MLCPLAVGVCYPPAIARSELVGGGHEGAQAIDLRPKAAQQQKQRIRPKATSGESLEMCFSNCPNFLLPVQDERERSQPIKFCLLEIHACEHHVEQRTALTDLGGPCHFGFAGGRRWPG